ncbi:MAG: Fic family protein [Bdellovibrionota bacterium]
MGLRLLLLIVLFFTSLPLGWGATTAANPCGYYFADIWRGITPATGVERSFEELGGFAYPVTAEEIETINRRMGGSTLLTGHLDSVLAGSARETSFFRKSAVILRGIAGNHMFDNGNKRTAQAVYEMLRSRNRVVNGVGPEEVRRIIDHIGRGDLKEIDEIAHQLRGY